MNENLNSLKSAIKEERFQTQPAKAYDTGHEGPSVGEESGGLVWRF